MQQRIPRGFLAGTLLGAVLAVAGVAGAHSTQGGDNSGNMMKEGMMEGGTMASMHGMMEMMAQCSDMMASMEIQHGAQPGDEEPATGTEDAS